MAHVKTGGSTRQGVNIAGKRRGVKCFGGEKVVPGNIIVRQKGTKMHPGKGVKMGRDFTIYASQSGIVKFRRMTGRKRGRFIVDVVSEKKLTKPSKAKAARPKAEPKSAKSKKGAKKA